MASNLSKSVESGGEGSMVESSKEEGMGKVDCPLGCGYEGRPESVEAHISSKTDDLHRGEVGHLHREELEAGEVDRPSSPPTDAPSVDGVDTDSADPDGENVEEDLAEEGEPEIVEDERAELPQEFEETSVDVDDDRSEDDGAEVSAGEAVGAAGAAGGTMLLSGLSDDGVNTWHVLGVIVVIGVAWWVVHSASSSSGETTGEQEATGEQEDEEEAGGPSSADWEVWE